MLLNAHVRQASGWLTCSLFLLTFLGSLQAATVQRFALEELTDNAERIFVGICRQATAERLAGQPFTRYRFTVIETLKGEPRDELEFHLPGGRLDGVHNRIPGMPSFVPGERSVLFLTAENQLGHTWPVGLGQGKFRIETMGAAKQPRVYQELDGLTLYDSGAARKATEQSLQGLPLERFLDQVRALLPPAAQPVKTDDAR